MIAVAPFYPPLVIGQLAKGETEPQHHDRRQQKPLTHAHAPVNITHPNLGTNRPIPGKCSEMSRAAAIWREKCGKFPLISGGYRIIFQPFWLTMPTFRHVIGPGLGATPVSTAETP